MANLFGTGVNQVPTNGMLGNMAFQDKAFVSVDKIGIGTTATDTGTANQTLQNYGGAYVSGNLGIGTTNPTTNLQVVGNIGVSGVVTATTFIGNLTGVASTATTAGYATTAGIATVAQGLTGTPNIVVGVVTATTFFGNLTGVASTATTAGYATTAGIATVAQGLTGTPNIVVGIATATALRVGTGGTIITTTGISSVGIGTTNPVVNFHVVGNTKFDATTIELNAPTVTISDPDLVLGLGGSITNPTDATASSGGIAVASTEGGIGLIDLNVVPAEVNPNTYKKFMWFRGGTGSGGLGAGVTDAWLSNYAIGIGSTAVPTGAYFAAGNVQFTQNDLAVVRNIKSSGVTTTITLNVGTGGTVITTTGIGLVGIGTTNPQSRLHIVGGTNAAGTAPLEISTGSLLSTVESDVFEYDGVNLYHTGNDITNGHRRTVIPEVQFRRLLGSNVVGTASSSIFGVGIGSFSVLANTLYEFECNYYVTKTVAGTATFNFVVNSGTFVTLSGTVSPLTTGIAGATGALVNGGALRGGTTGITTIATASLANATSYAGNIKLTFIPSSNAKFDVRAIAGGASGTLTFLGDSYMKIVGYASTISAGNVA